MRHECTFLFLLTFVGYSAGVEIRRDEVSKNQLDWWQTTVIYHVYPRSFMDSDGDGVGDLKGIIEKIGHFRDMGVDCVCLSPIFKSPMSNFGYDTSNYLQIDSVLGTRKHFALLKKNLSYYNGMKLILDIVPNHSSDEHDWFKKSEEKIDPYTDYYVWRDAKIDENGSRAPPNNWQSLCNNSAWTWNVKRSQYYLHQFDPKQPYLNYREKELVEEMKDILRYWLDNGVDGFRLVGVPFLFEDQKLLNEREEAYVQKEKNTNDNYIHDLTRDLSAMYDVIHQFREVLNEYKKKDGKTRVLITEAYTSVENIMEYYGNETYPGADVPFNFGLINDLNDHSKADDFRDAVGKWLDHMPKGKQANWAIGNHRRSRVATRFGGGMVDAMNMLNLLLPGTAFTYAGEEIGMTDGDVRPRGGQAVDDSGPATDDGCRVLSGTLSPYQWNASASAGFSSNPRTWMPVNSDYAALNLAGEKKSQAFSHYHVYKRLIRLRKSPPIRHGTYQGFVLSERVFAFSRSLLLNSEWQSVVSKKYLVVINVGSQDKTVDISNLPIVMGEHLYVHTASTNMEYNMGDRLNVSSFTMKPKSALVLSLSKMDMHDSWDRLDLRSSSPPLVFSSTISLVALCCTILANRYGILDF